MTERTPRQKQPHDESALPQQGAEGKPSSGLTSIHIDAPIGSSLDITITKVPAGDQPRKLHTLELDPADLPARARVEGDAAGFFPAGGALRKTLTRLKHRLTVFGGGEGTGLFQRLFGESTGLAPALCILSLLVYLFTRLYRLSDYPIYFFTDEAIHSVLASDFLRDGLRDYSGTIFPTYFKNAALYNLSFSVYLQLLPTLLFGKSVFVTRAVSAVVTSLGAAAVALILKDGFKLRSWWSGVLLLGIAPAWYLHSRTAFETVLMASFYAWCIYFYLRYRQGESRFLLWCIGAGVLAFYSYSGGQLILLATAGTLFLVDLRYHLSHRPMLLRGLLLATLCAIPYLRFQATHPGETAFHLRMLNAYWLDDIPLAQKMSTFADNYLRSLDPAYWFFTHEDDLSRHRMDGFGHILWPLLPFTLLGLIKGVREIKQPAYRDLFLMTLLTPLGAATVGIGITRTMSFLIPATLWSAIGIDLLLNLVKRQSSSRIASVGLFATLVGISIWLTSAALTQGPYWDDDYGLGGMQYGAMQVFPLAGEKLESGEYDLIYITPTWANGADIVKRFFLPDELPILIGNAESFLSRYREELSPRVLFILTAREYAQLTGSDKVTDLRVDEVIDYPDGTHGFYLVSMRYADGVEEVFAAEQAERERPVTDRVELDAIAFNFSHPRLDLGLVQHMFDNDTYTMARAEWGNPATYILDFDQPVQLSGLTLTTGSMDYDLSITLTLDDGTQRQVNQRFIDLPDDPTTSVVFGNASLSVSQLAFEILNPTGGEDFQIHIREIQLDP